MAIKALSGPQLEPVSLAEAKSHLRVDHNTDDAAIAVMIQRAREYVEGRTRRHIVAGNYARYLDKWPDAGCPVYLRGPLISVDSISYYHPTLGVSVWPQGGNWQSDLNSEPGRVYPLPDIEWPDLKANIFNAVTISYQAGWSNPLDVPAVLRLAVLHLVAADYADRGDGEVPATDRAGSTADRLIWSGRR